MRRLRSSRQGRAPHLCCSISIFPPQDAQSVGMAHRRARLRGTSISTEVSERQGILRVLGTTRKVAGPRLCWRVGLSQGRRQSRSRSNVASVIFARWPILRAAIRPVWDLVSSMAFHVRSSRTSRAGLPRLGYGVFLYGGIMYQMIF